MKILGHRGAKGTYPENSLEAFAAALAAGADGVELDCRMTADEVLVVRHDDELPDGRCLSALTYAEARRAAPEVPTLADALDVIREAHCVVELKTQPGRVQRFAALAAGTLTQRRQPLVVSSFDAVLLRHLRAVATDLPTALLVAFALGEADLEWAVTEAAEAGHVELHPERGILFGPLGDRLVDRAASRGLGLVAWTVNDADEARRLRELGAAGVITDHPEALVQH